MLAENISKYFATGSVLNCLADGFKYKAKPSIVHN